MNRNCFIKFRITGNGLNFEEISGKLGQTPSFSYKKGETYTPKFGDKKAMVYDEDCWLLEAEPCKLESVEKTIEEFVLKLHPSADFIKELSKDFKVNLWVTVYLDEEQANLHLTAETLKLIGNMNLSFDCSFAFLKELYE